MNKLNLKSLFIPILLCTILSSSAAMAKTSIIKAGGMLDVQTGKIRGPVSIVIEDGLIQSIDPSTLPADATVFELGNKVLLPGLMDMHTHLTLDFFTGDDWVTMPVLETAPDWAIRGVVFADLTLQAGFTTVRDVGANAGFPDVALMRAIDRGMNGREFAVLVKNGIPALHAIQMSTINAADLLGVTDRGEIAPGKLADIIAVDGNPLENIELMEDISFVMKGGEAYKIQ